MTDVEEIDPLAIDIGPDGPPLPALCTACGAVVAPEHVTSCAVCGAGFCPAHAAKADEHCDGARVEADSATGG